jgi:sialidase-1
MKLLFAIPTLLLLLPPPLLCGASASGRATPDAQPGPGATASAAQALESFLGAPLFLPIQQLWTGGGGTNIVTAQDGTVVAFQSMASNKIRRSPDGGETWGAEIAIGHGATFANALVDERSGDILYVNPAKQWLWRSRDHGLTWSRETIAVRPDGFGLVPNTVSSMQPGITLQFGPHRGRLLMPARVQGPKYSNDVEWRPYHYSSAVYSDDGGRTWQTSHPFPVLGTGEAALAELSNGSILYNSREHMSPGNRFMAWSHDGGSLWLDAYRSAELPDGPRGSSYGCMGGMIRLPVEGLDILLYSNLDTDAGRMPDRVGASITREREKITVWASFNGGRTWPVKRLVFGGPSGYSNLAAGQAGTPSAGRIFLLFEGGPGGRRAGIQVAVFNLSWLLHGREFAGLLEKIPQPQ